MAGPRIEAVDHASATLSCDHDRVEKIGLIVAALVMVALAIVEAASGAAMIHVGMLLAGWSFALLAVSSLMVAGACVATCGGDRDARFRNSGAEYRAALMRRDFKAARGYWVEAMTAPFRKGSRARNWYFGAIGLGVPAFIGAYVGIEIADSASVRRLIDLLS